MKPVIPEGWTFESLEPAARETALLQMNEPNRYMATIDFKNRLFRSGLVVHGGSATGKNAKVYKGRGWQQRLVDDAVAWLRRITS